MLLALVLACGPQPAKNWIDSAPTCAYTVQDWSDDLLMYIAQGDGSGAFSFDPQDEPRTSLEGEYDATSGDFEWSVNFDGDYFLDAVSAEGYGTVYHDGDLDLLWQQVTRDVLDATSTDWVRLERYGCEVERLSWADGSDDVFRVEGEYEDDTSFSWSADVPGYDWRGTMWSDATSRELIEADDGTYDYRTDTFADGTTESSFNLGCYDAYTCVGEGETDFDGGSAQRFDVLDGGDLVASIVTAFDYAGNGTQTFTYPNGDVVSCDFTIASSGACSYRCDDGDRGSC